MPPEAARRETGPELASLTREAVRAVEGLLLDATQAVRARVAKDSQTLDRLLDREQRATHALAWLATYVEAIRQICAYAERMQEAGFRAAFR
jgi:(2S)-methylsuccinyl-CoA dehydrogenase